MPVISEGVLLFIYLEATLPSSPTFLLPLVAKQLQPFCRTCLLTTNSLNHYHLLKNTNLRMKTDTGKTEKHTFLYHFDYFVGTLEAAVCL